MTTADHPASARPQLPAHRRAAAASRARPAFHGGTGTEARRRDRPSLMVRIVDRLTRRWTVDLYDVDFQFESLDLDAYLANREERHAHGD